MKKVNIFHNTLMGGFQLNDVLFLSENFETVNLFCSNVGENLKLPENVKVYTYSENFNAIGFFKRLTLLPMGIRDLFTKDFSWAYLIRFRFNFAFLTNAFVKSKDIERVLEDGAESDLFISYWWDNSALALALLKKRNKIAHFYCRAHGRDLFEYREPLTRKLPFRLEVLRETEKIFSVSQCGMDYLKERYPKFQQKMTTHCLGSKDYGFTKRELAPVFTIATVCKIRNIKRVFLLAEALAAFNVSTKWVHIGGKALAERDESVQRYYNAMEAVEKNPLIEFVDKGNVSQKEVLNTLVENKVELLVSVSETEGLPVSIMEAFSAGIPVLATDVGGCSELVNEATGKLLSSNPNTDEINHQLMHFFNSRIEYCNRQIAIRENWEEKYNIAKNYRVFCKTLAE